ncbi:MAG: glycosyltransferase family 39 protein [Bacteroidota bacterium]|nr:glycosyltransferase family 39 protein [Bacteroidota bacterium]
MIVNDQLTVPELRDMLLGEKQNEGYKMYREVVDNSAPLAALTHELLDSVFGRSILARHILAFIIIFLQSAYVGVLFISKRVLSENTYIPSLMFALLFFFSYDTLSLSNELLGSGFLLLALNNIFAEIEFRNERDESIFNVGICISLASLFAFSFVVYLFCAIVILLIFTRSTVRKHLLLIFGFLMPHLLTLSIAYLNDSTRELWNYFYLPNLSFESTRFVDTQTLLTLAAFPLLYFAVSLFMLNREARFSKYQSQILQAVLLWVVFSVLFVLYANDLRPQTLIVFIPGISLLLTHFFLLIRRKKFVNLNFWVLLVGIITMAYLARYEKIPSVDYSRLLVHDDPDQVRNKRILILSDEVDLYRANNLATPFLNWGLSEEIFRNPDYYNNVTRVYRSFKNDPPDIIYDRENLLGDFFFRMPEIGESYIREGERYTRRINN